MLIQINDEYINWIKTRWVDAFGRQPTEEEITKYINGSLRENMANWEIMSNKR